MSNKKMFADKLLDLANYTITGIALGHVLLNNFTDSAALIVAFGIFLILYGIVFLLLRLGD